MSPKYAEASFVLFYFNLARKASHYLPVSADLHWLVLIQHISQMRRLVERQIIPAKERLGNIQ
jgi:hypothetical protein